LNILSDIVALRKGVVPVLNKKRSIPAAKISTSAPI